jgi:hypothetical protein
MHIHWMVWVVDAFNLARRQNHVSHIRVVGEMQGHPTVGYCANYIANFQYWRRAFSWWSEISAVAVR